MNILRLHAICADKDVLVSKLREWNLIPLEGEYMCPRCSGPFTLSELHSRPDGWKWRCFQYIVKRKQKRRRCGYSREFRRGTFFEKSKLSIFQVLAFVNLWVMNASLKLITQQLEISTRTAIDWASFCREVIYKSLFVNPEKIVKIDECKFGKRNLARYIFYKKCDALKLDRTEEFFRIAGKLYDPRKMNDNEDPVIHVADDEERAEIEENF